MSNKKGKKKLKVGTRNTYITNDIFPSFKLFFQNKEESLGLSLISLLSVRDILLRVAEEVAHLTSHGTKASHLPHEPRESSGFLAGILGQELAGFLGEVDQNGATFEDGEGTARGFFVDDGGDLGVGIHLFDVPFLELRN